MVSENLQMMANSWGNYSCGSFIPLFFQNNGLMNTQWNFPAFGSSLWSTSSNNVTNSTPSTTDAYEEYKKKIKEDEEKALQQEAEREANRAFEEERALSIKQAQSMIEAQDEALKEIESKKKSDGSAIIRREVLNTPELNEDGTRKTQVKEKQEEEGGTLNSIIKWGGSAYEAAKNIGKGILGIKEDGTIDKKTLAQNAITVGAAGLACCIPYIGPVIRHGLLTFGLGSGAYSAYKGIKNLNKAKKLNNPEAEEKARQDICAGAITGLLSAFGLRSIGKAASSAAKASGATNASSKGISAIAQSRSGLGKVVEVASQTTRDLTINPLRTVATSAKADKALIAAKGGGVSGFTKAFGSKVHNSVGSLNSFRSKYDNQYQQMEAGIVNRQTELLKQFRAETNASKRALIKAEYKLLKNNLEELHSLGTSVKSKADFEKLMTQNAATKNKEQLRNITQNAGGYEVNGEIISKKNFDAFCENMEIAQNNYQVNLNKLVKHKESYMRQYAGNSDKHKVELDEYTQMSLRQQYNTAEKLKAAKESLTRKISDYEEKITKAQEKLNNLSKPKKIQRQQTVINNLTTLKNAAEEKLAFCNGIKFKKWNQPSNWFKNEYQMAIGGHNSGVKDCLGLFVTPGAATAGVMAQINRPYSSTSILNTDLTEISPEDLSTYIKQITDQKQAYENAIEQMNNIKTAKEWDEYKAQLQARAEAQAQAQAQAAAEDQAQVQENSEAVQTQESQKQDQQLEQQLLA